MTKLKQIAVVVGKGELRLHPLLSSTRTMIKKDLPRFVLSLGKVGTTKCQYNGIVIGLGCIEVGLVSDLLGWNRSWCFTSMVNVEVSMNIIVITITRLNIKGGATTMDNIAGTATTRGNIEGSLIPDRCHQDILVPGRQPLITGKRPRNTLAC